MICNNCGRNIEEGTTVCPYCGNVMNAYNGPVHTMYSPNYDAEKKALEDAIFNFGLWGLLLSVFCCIPLVGLVLSIIALVKVKKFKATYGPLVDRSSTGNVLAIIGLIVGLIPVIYTVVYVVIYIVAFIVALSAGGTDMSSVPAYVVSCLPL